MYNELSNLGISAIRRITDLWRGAKADSLIDYTQVTRVEPIVLIDADCLYLESLHEVQQSLLSIFAGYYLQAVAISTTVGKIDVRRHLDKLNPSRNPVDSAADTAGWLLAQESYRFKLPTPADRVALEAIPEDERDNMERERHEFARDKSNVDYTTYNLKREQHESDQAYKRRQEAFQRETFDFNRQNVEAQAKMAQNEFDARTKEVQRNYELNREKFGHEKAMSMAMRDLQEKGLQLNRERFEYEQGASGFALGRDTMSTIRELSNLSVGKLFSVEITDGNHSAEIPVSIRLMASSIPSTNLVHILSLNTQDNSVKARYHKWKAGRLEFIKDLVMCQDLIDAHRRNLMADKDGVYTNLVKRQRNNGLATIVSGNPSIATASNLVILSSDTAAKLELEINGKLEDFKTREKIFKETYIMIMAVIDKQWERVTFYHRGIHHRTEVGVRDLKAANKGNGPDVSEILKAYQVGNSPSL